MELLFAKFLDESHRYEKREKMECVRKFLFLKKHEMPLFFNHVNEMFFFLKDKSSSKEEDSDKINLWLFYYDELSDFFAIFFKNVYRMIIDFKTVNKFVTEFLDHFYMVSTCLFQQNVDIIYRPASVFLLSMTTTDSPERALFYMTASQNSRKPMIKYNGVKFRRFLFHLLGSRLKRRQVYQFLASAKDDDDTAGFPKFLFEFLVDGLEWNASSRKLLKDLLFDRTI